MANRITDEEVRRGKSYVRGYGAKGDGVTNDTAAIQESIDDRAAAGGGLVVLAPGTYKTTGIALKAGVTLVGFGPGVSVLRGTAYGAALNALGISNFGVRDLSLTSDGTPGIKGFYASGSSLGSLHNVDIYDVSYMGIFLADSSSDIDISKVRIRNVSEYQSGIGGTGLHLFDNVTRVHIDGLRVDGTDGNAIWLDAQTTGGTPRPIIDCVLNGLILRNFGRISNPSAGVATQGAQRCVGTGWVIGPSASPTTLQNCGIVLNVDQGNVPTANCVFSDIVIANVGVSAIKIRAAQRNRLANVSILNPDGALANYAITFEDGFVDEGTGPAPDNTDNVIDGLSVATNGEPYTSNYNRGVLFSGVTSNCYRNRVINAAVGSPTDVPVFWNGANAPSVGADANSVT